MTLWRVVWAFALAMSIGTALGLVMGRFPALDRWLDPWLVVFLNLPALVLIVLCYLWIGLNETAAITAVVLNKIPNVTTILREGARALDPGLAAMARVYRMPPLARLRHVVLPQLAPFLTGAARSGIAVIWKIVLVVEFLGRSNGIGFQIHMYFQLFNVTMVLVYALVVHRGHAGGGMAAAATGRERGCGAGGWHDPGRRCGARHSASPRCCATSPLRWTKARHWRSSARRGSASRRSCG